MPWLLRLRSGGRRRPDRLLRGGRPGLARRGTLTSCTGDLVEQSLARSVDLQPIHVHQRRHEPDAVDDGVDAVDRRPSVLVQLHLEAHCGRFDDHEPRLRVKQLRGRKFDRVQPVPQRLRVFDVGHLPSLLPRFPPPLRDDVQGAVHAEAEQYYVQKTSGVRVASSTYSQAQVMPRIRASAWASFVVMTSSVRPRIGAVGAPRVCDRSNAAVQAAILDDRSPDRVIALRLGLPSMVTIEVGQHRFVCRRHEVIDLEACEPANLIKLGPITDEDRPHLGVPSWPCR